MSCPCETAAKDSDSWWHLAKSAASTTTDYTISSASYVGENAKKAWHSEVASTATSSIKHAALSTGNYLGSYWPTKTSETPEASETSEVSGTSPDPSFDKYRGAAVALWKNSSQYAVKAISTKSANVLNIFDKSKISSIGNPQSFARVEAPHLSVKFPHINQFKKSPIPISATGSAAAGYIGKVAEKANDVAPLVTAAVLAVDGYRIGREAVKDYGNGTTRNTIQQVSTITGGYASGWIGAVTGSSIGSWIFPGLGTICGGLIGAALAGSYGGSASHVAAESVLDRMKWDVVPVKCIECDKEYEWRKYEQKQQAVCCIPKRTTFLAQCQGFCFKSKL